MAPKEISVPEDTGNFELICSLNVENYLPVHKYKSRKTGLTVVIGEAEGPVVNGYFCVATEAHDDDGLPHTLEHLIFTGSESYPYKGVLDLLANRCLASGTNAWTSVDHTCYTITTAGSEGFLTLMPIFLDHILYPKLTDYAYVTEVHHITNSGDDGGVVYCEMQGRESIAEILVKTVLLHEMYPGDCGYKAEVGGALKNLRESTNNAKVKQYHEDFYRPDNLTVIITGPLQPNEVFQALAEFEEKLISKGPLKPFIKPWKSPLPPLTKSVETFKDYPCDDEDNGFVYVGWRGPTIAKGVYLMNACNLFLKYLTCTTISPLQSEFIEISDPLASSLEGDCDEFSMKITFNNVPKDKLDEIRPKLEQILLSISEGKEKIDMKWLRTVLQKGIIDIFSIYENNPDIMLAMNVIKDMIYGNTVEELKERLHFTDCLQQLQKEPETFWLGLLKKYLIDAPKVVVKGRPSISEQKRMKEAEKQRVETQIQKLGADGLKKAQKKLKNAVEKNEIPPPADMLTCVPIPSTESINFHKIVRYTSDSKEPTPKFDLSQVPVNMHLDHVNTNFVYIYVLMDSTNLSPELRSYLPVFLKTLCQSPVKRGTEIIPYEQVVAEMETDTINIYTGLGPQSKSDMNCGSFSHTVSFTLELEEDKYEKCINWIHEILYKTIFTPERLKVNATKIINKVAEEKRNGDSIVVEMMDDIYYVKDSNNHVVNILRQYEFLNNLVEKINKSNIEEILKDIEQVRSVLTNPANMTIHLALNLNHISLKYPSAAALWAKMLPADVKPVKKRLNVTPDHKLMSAHEKTKGSCILGLGSIESTFLVQTAPSINDFNNPDIAPLMLYIKYLVQPEGPLWKQIRGNGLSYSYQISLQVNKGLIKLSFFRSSNIIEAYKKAMFVCEEQVSQMKWDATLLESAKSSLIFDIVNNETNITEVVKQSMMSYFKGTDRYYNKNLLKSIEKVSLYDLNRVGKLYLSILFDPGQTKTTIVCSPAKVEKITEDFKELNIKLQIRKSLEETFLI